MKNRLSRCEWKRGKLLITGILLCGTTAEPLQAGEFAYGAGYIAEHSDNINRVSTDKKSDWINSLLAGFAYQENSEDVVARVLAQETYNNYRNNSYSDESLFDLVSSATWTISPQRFYWTLEDTYQHGLINILSTDVPTNRTHINVLSTGPDAHFHLSPVHTVSLGARLGDVSTGEVEADNKRATGTASWAYQSSPTTTLSLNYQILNVRYDKPSNNPDYVNQEEYFRAHFHPSRSQFIVDLGARHIKFDQGSDTSGTLARLTWTRESTPQSSFGASYTREFSDSGTATLVTTAAATPGTGTSGSTQTIITGDVYESKGGSVFYDYRGTHFIMHLLAGQRKLDYFTAPQDNKETTGNLEFDYIFSATTSASMYTQYTKTEYLNFIREDRDQNSGVRLNYHLTRTVSVGLGAARTERHSSDPTLSYVDNRILFTLLYSTAPLFTPLHIR